MIDFHGFGLSDLTVRIEFYNARGNYVELLRTAEEWLDEAEEKRLITDDDLLIVRVEAFDDAGRTIEFTDEDDGPMTFKDLVAALSALEKDVEESEESEKPNYGDNNHVQFGMFWQSYGRQSIKLPSHINPADMEAVIAYIKSVWDDIGIPDGSYVSCSDELDEESNIVVYNEPAEPANTRFHYVYRDAGGNRWPNAVVLSGTITQEQEFHILLRCMMDAEQNITFFPEQVGLPLERSMPGCRPYDPELDCDFAAIEGDYDAFEATDDAPTVDMTVEDLVKAFDQAAENWGKFG